MSTILTRYPKKVYSYYLKDYFEYDGINHYVHKIYSVNIEHIKPNHGKNMYIAYEELIISLKKEQFEEEMKELIGDVC